MRVYNLRDKDIPEDAVFIGRPSKFGNPFVIGRHGDREQVIKKYRAWIMGNSKLLTDVKNELHGKSLICYCSPLPCHGDILVEIANEIPEPQK